MQWKIANTGSEVTWLTLTYSTMSLLTVLQCQRSPGVIIVKADKHIEDVVGEHNWKWII